MKGFTEYVLVMAGQPLQHGQVVWENQVRKIREIGWVVKFNQFYISKGREPTTIRKNVVLMPWGMAKEYLKLARETVPYLTYKLVKITRYKVKK